MQLHSSILKIHYIYLWLLSPTKNGSKYSRMDQVEFVEDRPYHFKFFKNFLQQIFSWSILEYLEPYVSPYGDPFLISKFSVITCPSVAKTSANI